MKGDKIKIIYILGTGHCGSTLLDLIIGSSKEVFSLGELAFYNIYRDNIQYKYEADKVYLCTCKKTFNTCNFWTNINTNEKFNIKKFFSLSENLKITLSILFPFLHFNFDYKDDTYLLCKKAYNTIKKNNKNIQYIMDSSKDPRRLFYLMRDKRIDLSIIFLIRDGIAVGHSYNKIDRLKIGLKRKSFFKSIFLWIFVNIISFKLIKTRKNVTKISYDLFCQNPEHYINLINQKLNIKIDKKNYIDNINQTKYHNIDGNNFRFKKIKNIKYDSTWKKKLNPIKKIIGIILIDKIFNKRWVYNKK